MSDGDRVLRTFLSACYNTPSTWISLAEWMNTRTMNGRHYDVAIQQLYRLSSFKPLDDLPDAISIVIFTFLNYHVHALTRTSKRFKRLIPLVPQHYSFHHQSYDDFLTRIERPMKGTLRMTTFGLTSFLLVAMTLEINKRSAINGSSHRRRSTGMNPSIMQSVTKLSIDWTTNLVGYQSIVTAIIDLLPMLSHLQTITINSTDRFNGEPPCPSSLAALLAPRDVIFCHRLPSSCSRCSLPTYSRSSMSGPISSKNVSYRRNG
jgi:hypothetical protein